MKGKKLITYSRNSTWQGAGGELWFMWQCWLRKLILSKPVKDVGRYDFICDNRSEPLKKVQVKTLTYNKDHDYFSAQLYKYKYNKQFPNGIKEEWYVNGAVDVFVFIILGSDKTHPVNKDMIWIVPQSEVGDYTNVMFFPHREPKRTSFYSVLRKYYNAWYLLTGEKQNEG